MTILILQHPHEEEEEKNPFKAELNSSANKLTSI